jgi:hypothetical protein
MTAGARPLARDLKGGPKSGRLKTLLRVVLALFPETSVTDVLNYPEYPFRGQHALDLWAT